MAWRCTARPDGGHMSSGDHLPRGHAICRFCGSLLKLVHDTGPHWEVDPFVILEGPA